MAARFVTKKENYFQGVFRIIGDTFSSLDRFSKGLILFTILIVLATPYIVKQYQTISGHAAPLYNLKSYYPDTNLINKYYLEGFNYVTKSPTRAVLWFEPQDQYTFRVYNYAPEDTVNKRCHYDQLSWWADGYLRYVKTVDNCVNPTNEIDYGDSTGSPTSGPIIFLPSTWDGVTNWIRKGSSTATYLQGGVVKCTGVNNWTASIVGVEQIAPGVQGVHWQSAQTTIWQTGNLTGQCYAGYTTHWLEDYWLYANLPISGGGTAPALKRSKGGNQDIPNGTSWDIWFDHWQLLPWIHPQH